MKKSFCQGWITVFSATFLLPSAFGQGVRPEAPLFAPVWEGSHVSGVKVTAASFAASFMAPPPKMEKLGEKECITGYQLNFSVEDRYAFDVDEPIELEVEFDLRSTYRDVILTYDNNGASASSMPLSLPPQTNTRWLKKALTLERARFANSLFEEG